MPASGCDRRLRGNGFDGADVADGSVANRRAKRQQSFDGAWFEREWRVGGAWVARMVGSLVVVVELVPHGDNRNGRLVFDFKYRAVARSSNGVTNSLRNELLPALRQMKGDDFTVAMPARYAAMACSGRPKS